MKSTSSFLILFVFLFVGLSNLSAQKKSKESLSINGYTDFYFGSFNDELGPNQLQQFTTVSPRDSRIGINAAQLGLGYTSELVRGNLTLHYGDIAEATWSSDFSVIQEANVGFQLFEDIWIDGGFFRTHIGTESFLPKNNLLSSTAVATYNEPFYQSGIRLSFEMFENADIELWFLNGYNAFLDNNDAKSFGVLFSYDLSDNQSLTYTNIMGRESLDGIDPSQFRCYHNFYYNGTFGDFEVIAGADFGRQTNSSLTDPTESAKILTYLLTARYNITEKLSVTSRYESFDDEDGFISGTFLNSEGNQQGLQLTALTIGLEYAPTKESYIRFESRFMSTDDKLQIFSTPDPSNNRREMFLTMGYHFDRKLF